jgi:hypothetical protein
VSEPEFTEVQRRFLNNTSRIAPLALGRGDPLYRFLRYATDADKASIRSALVDRRFRFARPRDFNDPFDCRPHFRVPGLLPICRRRWFARESIKLARERFPNDPAKEQQARDELARHSTDWLVDVMEQSIRDRLLDTQLMLCLAGNRHALQMWAYYADRQRGVAIHLRPNVWPVAAAMRVSYTSRYPTVPLSMREDDCELTRRFALRKAKEWREEDEYRVLVQDEDPQRFALEWIDATTAVFPRGAIAGVTVGCLMDPADQHRVTADAKAATPPLPVYRAVSERRRFKLTFEQIA